MEMVKYSPLMTVTEFASSVGVSEGVVNGWVKRDYVPTFKVGRHRLINVAKLNSLLTSPDTKLDTKLDTGSEALEEKLVVTSETQLDLFKKLPRNKRRNLQKKHGSFDAAVRSVSL